MDTYNGGTSSQWEQLRFGVMNWIQQECPEIATLAHKVEKLEAEPEEPIEAGARALVGQEHVTTEEKWGS